MKGDARPELHAPQREIAINRFESGAIVIAGSGIASTFLVPALMACYWRRATAAGALTSMLVGSGTVLLLLVIGIALKGGVKPHLLLGMDPIVWGVLASAIAGIGVSLLTPPPDEALVSRLFDAPTAPAA